MRLFARKQAGTTRQDKDAATAHSVLASLPFQQDNRLGGNQVDEQTKDTSSNHKMPNLAHPYDLAFSSNIYIFLARRLMFLLAPKPPLAKS